MCVDLDLLRGPVVPNSVEGCRCLQFILIKEVRVPNMRKVSPQNPSGTRSIVKGFLYSTTAIAMIAAPAQANDMDEMRAELQNLLDRMERVEGQQVAAQTAAPIMNRQYLRKRAPQLPSRYAPYDVRDNYIMPETARANGVVGGDLPGSFKVPGSDTSVAISGHISMRATYDGGASEGSFSSWGHAGTIQPDESNPNSNGQLRFESLSNSMAVSTSSESNMGTVTTNLVLSTDRDGLALEDTLSLNRVWAPFANVGVGNWTFGQQGFAFTSGDCYGETVATGGAPCPLGIGPAIQYAGGGGGMNYRIQLVHPAATLDSDGRDDMGGVNINGSLPDLQARLSFGAGAANIGLGLQLRQYGYDNNNLNTDVAGASDTDTGFGIFPEISIPLGKDKLYAGFAYTDGGRNTNINHSLWTGGRGDQGTVDPVTGNIDSTVTYSLHTYYTHWWNASMRSTLHLSGANSNPEDYSLGADDETPPLTQWRSLTGNLVWSLVPRVTTGVGVSYHSAKFRGDNNENQGVNNAIDDAANEAVEGHWSVTVSY